MFRLAVLSTKVITNALVLSSPVSKLFFYLNKFRIHLKV
jgi:hypothetical protein